MTPSTPRPATRLVVPGTAAGNGTAPRLPSADAGPLVRAGALVVLLGLGGFLLWAGLVPLDRAIHGSGALVVADQRKSVQHETGGRVAAIAVGEGARVEQGQTLVELDTTAAAAELEGVARQRVLAWASVERLRAQREGRGVLQWSPELEAYATAQEAVDLLAAQRRLHATRGEHLRSEQAQLGAREAQLRAEVDGHRAAGRRHAEQRAVLEEQQRSLADLTRQGYYPKLRLMDLERQILQVRTEETRVLADAARAAEGLGEAGSGRRRRAYEQQQQDDAELLEAERQHASLRAREAVLRHTLASSRIVAPVAGTVVGLAVHTVGGVIRAGATLMDIVPLDEPCIVEARMPLQATEGLQAGQAVRLHFATMERARTPVVDGEVLTVAADRLEDERSGQPYLLVRSAVGADGVRRLGEAGVALRAGLPVEVFVNVGRRTLLSYLTKPMADGFARSLIE